VVDVTAKTAAVPDVRDIEERIAIRTESDVGGPTWTVQRVEADVRIVAEHEGARVSRHVTSWREADAAMDWILGQLGWRAQR
jgi:hypothetical protein